MSKPAAKTITLATLSIASQMNILKAAFFTPCRGGWGLSLCCLGPPGTAKTSVGEEFAATWDVPCEVLATGERGEGAFGVVPVPAEDENGDMVLAYPAPEWTARFMKSGRGLIIVDEIIDAPPALRPPLMGLILNGRIGGRQLPGGVRRMAFGNPVELSANGFELPAPLANRMGHMTWGSPTIEEHTQFMLRGDDDFEKPTASGNAAEEEERVKKLWGGAKAQAVGLETSFLAAKRASKNKCPPPGDPRTSGAWASDRTWEMATRALASSRIHGLSEIETETFVSAFIGAGDAAEWFTFMSDQDLPDPEKLLDGRTQWSHNPIRLDRTITVLQSCVALVTPKGATKRADRAGALWGLLEKMAERKADLDIVVPSVHALIDADLHAMKAAANTLAVVQPILKAAGVTPRRGR